MYRFGTLVCAETANPPLSGGCAPKDTIYHMKNNIFLCHNRRYHKYKYVHHVNEPRHELLRKPLLHQQPTLSRQCPASRFHPQGLGTPGPRWVRERAARCVRTLAKGASARRSPPAPTSTVMSSSHSSHTTLSCHYQISVHHLHLQYSRYTYTSPRECGSVRSSLYRMDF